MRLSALALAALLAVPAMGEQLSAEYELVEPCEEGEQRPDVDGCNTCRCAGGSLWLCTLAYCKPTRQAEVVLPEPEARVRWSKGRKATAACLALDLLTTAYGFAKVEGFYDHNPVAAPAGAVSAWIVLSDRQAEGMKPKHWRIGWGARCTAAAWNLRLIYKYGR